MLDNERPFDTDVYTRSTYCDLRIIYGQQIEFEPVEIVKTWRIVRGKL